MDREKEIQVLNDMIKSAEWSVNWHTQKLQEEKIKLELLKQQLKQQAEK